MAPLVSLETKEILEQVERWDPKETPVKKV